LKETHGWISRETGAPTKEILAQRFVFVAAARRIASVREVLTAATLFSRINELRPRFCILLAFSYGEEYVLEDLLRNCRAKRGIKTEGRRIKTA